MRNLGSHAHRITGAKMTTKKPNIARLQIEAIAKTSRALRGECRHEDYNYFKHRSHCPACGKSMASLASQETKQ